MHSILTLPPALLFLALLLFVSVTAGLALLLLYALRRVFKTPMTAVPVATFLSVVATAWALALGFAAADIWTLRNAADRAASEERSAVLRLAGIAEAEALDVAELHQVMVDYVERVSTVEWGQNLNGAADPDVDEILQSVRLIIVDLAMGGLPVPLVNKTVSDFDELQDARNDRLSVGQSVVDEAKWYLVVILTVMSMVAISVCHLDRPMAGFNALWIYSAVVLASLWVLGIHINPYIHMTVPFAVVGSS